MMCMRGSKSSRQQKWVELAMCGNTGGAIATKSGRAEILEERVLDGAE